MYYRPDDVRSEVIRKSCPMRAREMLKIFDINVYLNYIREANSVAAERAHIKITRGVKRVRT